MDMQDVPAALLERLGADASRGLLDLFNRARDEMRDDVVSVCTERFERRLVEQISGVRVQIAQLEASCRLDSTETRAGLRQEITEMGGALRQEMAKGRVELLKWCFLFWIGQVFAIATILGVILRLYRP
jgi:hypothetical protein